jgi:hypothetical protein
VRDCFILAVVLGSVPLVMRQPWIGIVVFEPVVFHRRLCVHLSLRTSHRTRRSARLLLSRKPKHLIARRVSELCDRLRARMMPRCQVAIE